ncbi:hypothetical protein NQ318_023188 [Aromia moschata]|uniref:DUF4817 domain-containing protein n=1 Tax=Aromia moschata TaxID=1265417 RepID=A0AAV8Y074_9CUCU|nr:hypothetical protein NQ318_023188 [Aromia moschata]
MIGYGDRARTQCEVVRLFRETHPDLPPLNQGTISKIEAQYREMGHVRKVPSKRQAVVDDDTKLNLLLALEENPITPARQLARDSNLNHKTVLKILKYEKKRPYKMQAVQQLLEDDPDRRDPKLRQIVTMGSQDTLEEKTVTVCCANDFVNIAFINFCCTRKEIARLWTDSLLSLAYNLNQINGTTKMYLFKAYTKLSLIRDKSGNIPVKNVLKMFAQGKDDKKKVESILHSLGFSTGKTDTINPQNFDFETFFNFYIQLTKRTEVEKVFNEILL